MKQKILTLCALCALLLNSFAAEQAAPAAPTVEQQLETAKADLAKAQAEIAGLKTAARAVREQRDKNGQLYQDAMIDLVLVQQKIAALQEQLATVNEKLAKAEKPAADGAKEKPAQ
jgi:peptidoglycan hydrolase CwlO-like protein